MVNVKFLWFATALLLFFSAHHGPAYALSQNYCLPSGEGLRTYFAPHKGASNIEINAYKASLDSLVKTLDIGHRFEILLVNEAGVTKAFSECFPGCPKQSLGEQLFGGSSCKATLAKRDRVQFFRKVKKNLQQVLNSAKEGTAGYSALLPTLAAVQAHEKIHSGDLSDVLVSSMYIGASVDKKDLDKFFVRAVQNKQAPFSLPSMEVTGMPINADLINLWKDLYSLNGQTFTHR